MGYKHVLYVLYEENKSYILFIFLKECLRISVFRRGYDSKVFVVVHYVLETLLCVRACVVVVGARVLVCWKHAACVVCRVAGAEGRAEGGAAGYAF